MVIIWTTEAKEDYWNNIDYLLEQFPIEVAERFVQKVDDLTQQLKNKNVTFKPTSRKNIYQITVVKQITLFYLVNDQKISLLRFWNNKKDPKSLKL